jgi:hypothetical protein
VQWSCNNGHLQYVKRSLVGEGLQLCAMEIKIAKPPRNGILMVPCGEGVCTAYRSQRSGRTQQEGYKHEVNHVGIGEGSLNPSYHWEK